MPKSRTEENWGDRRPHWLPELLVFGVLVSLLQACQVPQVDPTGSPTPQESLAGTISSTIPENPGLEDQYVFYIHGRIMEEQGLGAVSPAYGPYLYEEILTQFMNAGYHVISEVRIGPTDPQQYAEFVANQVETLLEAGVPQDHITIIGFSKGGGISILVSNRLGAPRVNYVFLAICGDWLEEDQDLTVSGNILSIYEASDEYGSSCQPLSVRSPGINSFKEIGLSTGEKHGLFYTPDPRWVDPLLNWLLIR